MSGAGPASASCSSFSGPLFEPPSGAVASVTLTDNSLQIFVNSAHVARALAFASITHDDLYAVSVNGPVSAVESFTCSLLTPPGVIGHFSLGSTNVSPPVETIYAGASQGSGPCGANQINSTPPAFVVSLVATNNLVHLQTHIDVSGDVVDSSGGIFIQLTVNGFQDANGNPITATLIPEPSTLGTFALAFLIGAAIRLHLSSG